MTSEAGSDRSSLHSPRHTGGDDHRKRSSDGSADEGWVLVRKSLLHKPKFSHVFKEISEDDWKRSRAVSLRAVLDSCGQFHGGPSGEMWDDFSEAVKSHLGPQHEYLTIITEHKETMWKACSLVTVTTISDDAVSVDTLEDGGTHMTLSAPPSHHAYGSIELIPPSGKDGRRLCMHYLNWRWLLLYFPLTVVLIAVVATAISLIETSRPDTQRIETLEDTTVYLDSREKLWFESWLVEDCSPSGGNIWDNKTASSIQLVDSDDLVYYEENRVADKVEMYNTGTTPLVLNSPLYLLAGSSIQYQFCFHANSTTSPQPSEFFIFNDHTDYMKFVYESEDDVESNAIFHRELFISGPNTEECTSVSFNVSHAGFYFVTYRLPAYVGLEYKANIHVVSLNYTDYITKAERHCSLISGDSCTIDIPGSVFSTERYTILAYIPVNADTAPNTTHLCVTPNNSALVAIIPGVVAAFVLVLLIAVLACQIISFLAYKRRRGYLCIKPLNV